MNVVGGLTEDAYLEGRYHLQRLLLVGLFVSFAACTKQVEVKEAQAPQRVDECGDLRMGVKVYYGTLEPTLLPLTSGQKLAIGDFEGCTGLLINQRWVLTAAHCRIRGRNKFCIGEDPANPETCFDVGEVVKHDLADLSLVKLEVAANEVKPEVKPIPIFDAGFNDTWIGREVELAGYGTMEDGEDGTRKFSVERIVELSAEMVTVFADGDRGVCFGDSGGPLMVLGEDGLVRVGGVLSHGDSSCVGYDHFTRVGVFKEWIESVAGPTMIEGGPCELLDSMGRCYDTMAAWCEDEQVVTKLCGPQTSCGWSEAEDGYRCISDDDPCGGVDGYGECVSNVAFWCEAGERRSRDCGKCAQKCSAVSTEVGVYCVEDPCEGIDALGQCDGDVVRWCNNGALETVDCGANGEVCGWYNDHYGYYCIEQ